MWISICMWFIQMKFNGLWERSSDLGPMALMVLQFLEFYAFLAFTVQILRRFFLFLGLEKNANNSNLCMYLFIYLFIYFWS